MREAAVPPFPSPMAPPRRGRGVSLLPRLLPCGPHSQARGLACFEELRSSRLPSGWTPLELLKHVTHMELEWGSRDAMSRIAELCPAMTAPTYVSQYSTAQARPGRPAMSC